MFTYPLQFRHTTQFLNALTTVDSGEGRGREGGREGRGEAEGECWGKRARRREGWGERERVRGTEGAERKGINMRAYSKTLVVPTLHSSPHHT